MDRQENRYEAENAESKRRWNLEFGNTNSGGLMPQSPEDAFKNSVYDNLMNGVPLTPHQQQWWDKNNTPRSSGSGFDMGGIMAQTAMEYYVKTFGQQYWNDLDENEQKEATAIWEKNRE